MSKIIDFYFDFISPYSYIAYKKIKSMQNKKGIDFNYKPILLGGLHKLGNITAPAFNERKMKNMKNDCEIIANKNNISFKWNEKFPINTLYLMRGALYAKKIGVINAYNKSIFNAMWIDNVNLNDPKNIAYILSKNDLNSKEFMEAAENLEIKTELKKVTAEAVEKGLFGVPSFIVDNTLFFGQDRIRWFLN